MLKLEPAVLQATHLNVPPQALSRNPGIDLLRGLSIFLVVMLHIGLRIPLKHGVLAPVVPKRILDALIYNGYEAVFIFFVISGFLITSNALTRWGSLAAIHAREFYTRRAARILPCLLILVTILALLHFTGAKDYAIHRPNQSLPRAVFAALGLHLNWYEGYTGYLPANWDVLWSLSIEEVFYLAFPLLCLSLRKNWILAPSLGLLALSLPISRAAIVGNEVWQEKAYLPGMAAIATGVLAAMIVERFRLRNPRALLSLAAVGTSGIIAVLFFEDNLWNHLGNGTMLVLTFSIACLLLAFHWQSINDKPWTIPGTSWLRACGRLSYEIYLSHMFVVLTVVSIYKRSGKGPWWEILWYIPAVIFSCMLGWLVARYISIPAERIARRYLTSPAPSSTVK